MKLIEPKTEAEFAQYYQLRFLVLRKPWNQPEGSEKAPDDAAAIHAMLVDENDQAIGVCRLHFENEDEAQLRFMAIREDKQNLGLGNLLIEYLEEKALKSGRKFITLQAREKAVPFYKRKQYEIQEKTHLLFNEIQHYKMRKELITNRNKKQYAFLTGLALAAGAAAFFAFRRTDAPLETVPYVNLEKYAGKWFEIAAFPQRFQKGCNCTTADYKLHPDGYVEVYNSCNKNSTDGPKKGINGKAFVADKQTNAKLKVQFFWPLKGDYWILELAEDYSYAVVGTPDRKYLWILARQPEMQPAVYQMLVTSAKNKGFDITKLKITNQSCR